MKFHGAWHKANRLGKKPLSPQFCSQNLAFYFQLLGWDLGHQIPWSSGQWVHSTRIQCLPGIPAAVAGHGMFSSRVETISYSKAISF